MVERSRIEEYLEENPEASLDEITSEMQIPAGELLKYDLNEKSDFAWNEKVSEEADFEDEQEYRAFESRVENHSESFQGLREGIQDVVVGQEDIVEKVIISVICDGHVLLEGVPGLGKSLLVESLSKSVSDAESNRIQFVPDMLPSDVIGQRIYNQKTGDFRINKGPVFTNFLLADEINRAPPKTQAALMEVMQEKKVSIEEQDFNIESPYVVLATQNPVEQKGTYPLPEAIIDRFFMKLELNYPDKDNENKILIQNSIRDQNLLESLEDVISKDDILQAQEDVRNIFLSEDVRDYITELVTTARGENDHKIELVDYIDYAPSPRASIWLSLGASAKAMMEGRTYAKPKDVKEIAKPVLRHRVNLNYEARLQDIDSNQAVDAILNHVKVE
jgi:MoxR-like ATPase